MVQAQNFDLEGEYMVKSFDATPREVIRAMDKYNISKTVINEHRQELTKLYLKLQHMFSRTPIHTGVNYAALYLFTSNLILDDLKAKQDMSWNSESTLGQTVEESFHWFNQFKLSEKENNRS
jgi:hypothetical protein